MILKHIPILNLILKNIIKNTINIFLIDLVVKTNYSRDIINEMVKDIIT